jgi:hypothetical protein
MGILKRLLGGSTPAAQGVPAADGTVSIPHHFLLLIGDLKIAAEFSETRDRGDPFYSQGYVMTGPHGGQYGVFDDAILVSWARVGLMLSNVAGVTHYSNALQALDFIPSREVALRPEPTNRYDPNAVAVWDARGTMQLGYLPKEVAAVFRFDGHRGYVFCEYRESGTNKRIGVKLVIGPGLALDIPDD